MKTPRAERGEKKKESHKRWKGQGSLNFILLRVKLKKGGDRKE